MKLGLITSTISPQSNVYMLAHANKLKRIEEYKDAFSFYCDQLKGGVFDAISYVDNSGVDLADFKKIAVNKGVVSKVEFISYKSELSPKFERAYLELNLISHFMSHSFFLKEKSNITIWKITGRYKILNVGNIIKKSSTVKKDLYINYRNYPHKWTDLYFFGFSPNFFDKVFQNNLEYYRDTELGERALRRYLDDNIKQLNLSIMKRLPSPPKVSGIRGFDGTPYLDFRGKVKYYLRVIFNKVFPFLWV